MASMPGGINLAYKITFNLFWASPKQPEDFGHKTVHVVELLCHLAEFRDAEILTHTQTKVLDLRKMAKEYGLKAKGVKKDLLVGLLTQVRCWDLIFLKICTGKRQLKGLSMDTPSIPEVTRSPK